MLEPPPGRPLHTRQYPRYEASFPVECSTRQFYFSNNVRNISKGGLFLRSDRPLPLNEEVSLVLHLPGTEKGIYATGRVIWTHDSEGSHQLVPGSGIRFVGMTASDRAALESYLAQLTPGRTRPSEPR
jgi:type IV pilus assembly protein PilZ